MDYINLLHASGMYEKQTAKIIPFRSIDIFENAGIPRTLYAPYDDAAFGIAEP